MQSDGVHTVLSVDEHRTPIELAKGLLSRKKVNQNQPHCEKSNHKATELSHAQCYTSVHVAIECQKPFGVEVPCKMYEAGL